MKMPDKIIDEMFAPCGMNCMVCYVHLKEKKPCSGCLSNNGTIPDRCNVCEIKLCAEEKEITYCYKCDEFPCKKIENIEKSYQKRYQVSLIENSMFVKENSIQAFFAKEKSRWSCLECGGVISLHDQECSECKKKIN